MCTHITYTQANKAIHCDVSVIIKHGQEDWSCNTIDSRGESFARLLGMGFSRPHSRAMKPANEVLKHSQLNSCPCSGWGVLDRGHPVMCNSRPLHCPSHQHSHPWCLLRHISCSPCLNSHKHQHLSVVFLYVHVCNSEFRRTKAQQNLEWPDHGAGVTASCSGKFPV